MHDSLDIATPPLDPGYWNSDDLRAFGFKSVGENCRIATNCSVHGVENMTLGDNVRIDGFCTIVAVRGSVTLGSYIHIGGYCHLSAAADFVMEDFSGLSQGSRVYTATDDYSGNGMTNPMVPEEYTNTKIAPVRLGKHVIIGSGTVILPGCDVGEGSSVGALSLVTKTLPEWGVYAGTPARRVGGRSRNLLDLEKQFLSSIR